MSADKPHHSRVFFQASGPNVTAFGVAAVYQSGGTTIFAAAEVILGSGDVSVAFPEPFSALDGSQLVGIAASVPLHIFDRASPPIKLTEPNLRHLDLKVDLSDADEKPAWVRLKEEGAHTGKGRGQQYSRKTVRKVRGRRAFGIV